MVWEEDSVNPGSTRAVMGGEAMFPGIEGLSMCMCVITEVVFVSFVMLSI